MERERERASPEMSLRDMIPFLEMADLYVCVYMCVCIYIYIYIYIYVERERASSVTSLRTCLVENLSLEEDFSLKEDSVFGRGGKMDKKKHKYM